MDEQRLAAQWKTWGDGSANYPDWWPDYVRWEEASSITWALDPHCPAMSVMDAVRKAFAAGFKAGGVEVRT